MRFLMLYKPADVARMEAGLPPSPEEMARMGKLIEEQMRSGALLATEGCGPTAKGAKVQLFKGKLNVIDGPFTEAKEIIGGLAIMRASSKQEAIQQARDFLEFAGDGEVEVREIYDPENCMPLVERAR
jgi:hypothetical protein